MFILIALAAAAAAPAGAGPAQAPGRGEARRVVERQLAQPPRTTAEAGISAEEADVVMQRYIASIGTRLDTSATDRSSPR